jgi:hypothetical protein
MEQPINAHYSRLFGTFSVYLEGEAPKDAEALEGPGVSNAELIPVEPRLVKD